MLIAGCEFCEGRSTEVSAFRSQLQKVKTAKIHVPPDTELTFDWNSSTFGAYTSGKGVDFLRAELLRAVPPADE
jgi:hypothetical protein